MVKPDVKKNYYADLELPADSSIEDIRKQYRKLALKYHPDRNSGNEAECVPKFQAIQAAFEVLSDPDVKAKYDADRRKAGLYPRPSARPTPSYTTGYTPTTGRPPFRPSPTSPQDGYASNLNGAFRYTSANFPRPPGAGGPARRANAQEQADAWNRMNHARQPGPHPRRAEANPPPSSQPPPSAGWDSVPPRSPWPPKDERGQPKPTTPRTHPTRPPRAGFDPQHPNRDERQASGTSAYAQQHAFRPQRPTAERRQTDFPPPPAGAPPNTAPPYTSQKPDPLGHFRARYSDDEVPFSEGKPRPRMPYTTSTGEKTYLSSEALKRSASTRVPPRPGSSHASPLSERFDHHQARPRSASPAANRKPYPSPPPPGENVHGPHSEKTFMGPPPSQGPPRPHAGASDPDTSSSNSSSSSSDAPPNARSSSRRKAQPASAWRGRSGKASQDTRQEPDAGADKSANGPTKDARERGDTPNIFSENNPFMPTRPNSHRSRSHDHINTRFSPSDWQGHFSGNPGYFEPRPSSQTQRRSPTKTFDTPKQRVNSTDSGRTQMPPPPPGPPPSLQHPPTSDAPNAPQTGEAKFSAKQWADLYKEPSWAFQPGQSQSPTRATPKSRPPGRKQSTSKAKPTNAPKPVQVDAAVDEEHDSDVKHDSGAASASSSSLKDAEGERDGNEADDDDDGDAMDIDQETPVPPTSQQQEPRIIPVPPIQPKTRTNTDLPKGGAHGRHASQPTMPPPDQAPRARKLSTGATLKTDLSDLAAAAPFAPTKESGLNSISDLGSNLPFESKASTSHPTKSFTPRTFTLPQPPETPKIPTDRLTRANWEVTLGKMTAYMKDWSVFYKTMLDHFNARSAVLQQLTHSPAPPLAPTASTIGPGGTTASWLAAIGEPTGQPGFDTYLQGLREDSQIQAHWMASCEMHKAVVERFNEMREKARQNGVGA
ncbi:MAG: hypothetical protein M1822_008315 [Bathelium mastoideum]|nr:MAG: hypothetical protein M1822_008315 [Bathelium mastoideum]